MCPISPHGATGTAIDLPVDHQTGADTAGDLDVRQVPDPAPAPPDQLAERAEIGIVVDVHRYAEALGQLVAGVDAGPARQDRGGAERARFDVDRPGDTEADTYHLLTTDTGGHDQPLDQFLGPAESLGGGGVHIEGLGFLREHLMGEVPDGHPQMRMAEIHSDDNARVSAERDAAGPAAARRSGRDLDRSAVLQLTDDIGDRGRRQSRAPRDLRLGERTGHAHRAYDPFEVGPVQRRLRPWSLHDSSTPALGGRHDHRPRPGPRLRDPDVSPTCEL